MTHEHWHEFARTQMKEDHAKDDYSQTNAKCLTVHQSWKSVIQVWQTLWSEECVKQIVTELKADVTGVSKTLEEVKAHSNKNYKSIAFPRAREPDHDLVSEPAEAWNKEEEAMTNETSEKSDDWLVPINSNQLKDD